MAYDATVIHMSQIVELLLHSDPSLSEYENDSILLGTLQFIIENKCIAK